MAETTTLPWPVPADLTPRQVAAWLHAEIAAKSPEHAALVAAFEAIPRQPERSLPSPRHLARAGSPRYRRLSIYAAVRLRGGGEREAAMRAGICRDSRPQYEADFLGVIGGALGDC